MTSVTPIYQLLKLLFELIVVTIILIVSIANFAISLCIIGLIKIFYKYWYSKPFNILWGVDALLQYQGHAVYGPRENASVSYSTFRIKGVPDLIKWQNRFDKQVLSLPKSDYLAKPLSSFRKRIVRKFGYYIWEDDPDFSIANHVRLHLETYDTEKSLVKIVTRMTQTSYPKGHSPWEWVIIKKQENTTNSDQQNALDSEPEYVCAFRIHHSLADGGLIIALCSWLCDETCRRKFDEVRRQYESNPTKLSPLIKNNALLEFMASRKRGQMPTLKQLAAISVNIFHAIRSIYHITIETIFFRERNALHGADLMGRKILASAEQIDLQIFKDVAIARGCTVNDVFVYCTARAFQREDPDAKSIRAFTPIGVIKPGSFGTQNSTALFSYDLPIQDLHPYDYLVKISDILNKVKTSPDPLGLIILSFLLFNHIPGFLCRSRLLLPDGTIGISNLVGPNYDIMAFEGLVTDITLYAMNFSHKGGFCVGCFGFRNRAKLSATIDRAVASDDDIGDRFLSNVVEELKHLHALCQKDLQ